MPSSATSLPPLTSTLSMKSKSEGKSLQGRSMSLSSSQRRRTHATSDEFDLMRLSAVEQHDHEVIIKDGPKGSGKGKDDDGLKCSAFCICLPGFGNKARKTVKGRKGETKMDIHPVDPMMMSSTFSFENFARNSGKTNEDKEDDSISSYFELPSQTFKCDGAFVLDKDIKGEHHL